MPRPRQSGARCYVRERAAHRLITSPVCMFTGRQRGTTPTGTTPQSPAALRRPRRAGGDTGRWRRSRCPYAGFPCAGDPPDFALSAVDMHCLSGAWCIFERVKDIARLSGRHGPQEEGSTLDQVGALCRAIEEGNHAFAAFLRLRGSASSSGGADASPTWRFASARDTYSPASIASNPAFAAWANSTSRSNSRRRRPSGRGQAHRHHRSHHRSPPLPR